jgi:hypothetical protein
VQTARIDTLFSKAGLSPGIKTWICKCTFLGTLPGFFLARSWDSCLNVAHDVLTHSYYGRGVGYFQYHTVLSAACSRCAHGPRLTCARHTVLFVQVKRGGVLQLFLGCLHHFRGCGNFSHYTYK